ncbi:MAG: GNAT family N-acetyltransferase [Bacteroidetes bacterium]|nr:GNAT family N-acetyltransferase [Bacteroidota bacterium]
MTNNFEFCKLSKENEIPFDLLLLADETMEAIKKYIYDSDIYVLFTKVNTSPAGVVVINKVSDLQIEIKNIAVLESFQGKGIGSSLIQRIKEIAAHDNYKEIIVGTPDVGIREIEFYEKNGFIRYGIKKNFFIENYSIPIIEDGVILKDMVMLKIVI